FDIWLFPLSLWCFMAGALAYHAYAKLRDNKPHWLHLYAGLATTTVIAATATYNALGTPRLVYLFLVAACIPGLVLLARKNPLDPALGDLSYPIYLIHPLATIAIIPGRWGEYYAVAAVLFVAWVVTIVVERPIERYRRNRRSEPKLLVAA